MKTYIISGNLQQFSDYIASEKLNKMKTFFIGNQKDLCGLDNVSVHLTGEYWKNPVFNEFYEELRFRVKCRNIVLLINNNVHEIK